MDSNSLGFRSLEISIAILKKLESIAKYYRDSYVFSFRTSDVKARVKRIGGGYQGSDTEYRDTVLRYWRKYGIKPKRIWYSLLCDGKDAYDPRFVPDSIWFHDIIPFYNNTKINYAYADKGIYNRLLPNVSKPQTVVKRMAGYYYNGDSEQPISRDEAETLLAGEEHLIFKPSFGAKASGIRFYDRDEKEHDRLLRILNSMGSNFVVQRIVKQHPDLARLNPDSLNTIRVLSFRFKGEVHILSAQLRIGAAGSRVDNVSAGGSACSIKSDGFLYEKSVTRQSTWTDETPSGIKLSTIRVPNYEGIMETVKRLHTELPYFDLLGWDFAVGEDGTPIMVEYNTLPGQNQIGSGEPTFGDLTDEVFDEVFLRKTKQR